MINKEDSSHHQHGKEHVAIIKDGEVMMKLCQLPRVLQIQWAFAEGGAQECRDAIGLLDYPEDIALFADNLIHAACDRENAVEILSVLASFDFTTQEFRYLTAVHFHCAKLFKTNMELVTQLALKHTGLPDIHSTILSLLFQNIRDNDLGRAIKILDCAKQHQFDLATYYQDIVRGALWSDIRYIKCIADLPVVIEDKTFAKLIGIDQADFFNPHISDNGIVGALTEIQVRLLNKIPDIDPRIVQAVQAGIVQGPDSLLYQLIKDQQPLEEVYSAPLIDFLRANHSHWSLSADNLPFDPNDQEAMEHFMRYDLFNVLTNTDLVLAIKQKSFEEIKQLLSEGHDPNDRLDDCGLYPLTCAAHYGRADVVELLIDFKAKVLPDKHFKNTPFHIAARYNQLVVMKLLVTHYKDEIDLVDKDGDTALIIAAESGNAEMVKLLVNCGADVCLGEDRAIKLARENDHLDVVMILNHAKSQPPMESEQKRTKADSLQRFFGAAQSAEVEDDDVQPMDMGDDYPKPCLMKK